MMDRKKAYDMNRKTVEKILARIAPTMSLRGIDPDWSLWSHGAGQESHVETVGNDFMGLLATSMGYDWLWEFGHPVSRVIEGAKNTEKALGQREAYIQDLIRATSFPKNPKRRSK